MRRCWVPTGGPSISSSVDSDKAAIEPALPASPARTVSIRSVQLLRAVAALFVVAFHSTVLWHDKFDARVVPWANGNAGVDLFFVISGFIMVLSSRRLAGLADGWSRFIKLRLVRIVPMYWLVTAAKLAAIAAVPAMALHTRPTSWNVAASFLFVPSRDALGAVRPVLDVGWTLSFEMLFYVAFAAALLFRRDPLVVVGPAMVVLALAHGVARPGWPAVTTLADPIVLEFVFGLVIGRLAVRTGPLGPRALWPALLMASLAGLALASTDGPWERTAIWGVAAAFALYGAVLGESWLGTRIPEFAVQVGEASYSLYLTHGFVLPVVAVLLARSRLHGPPLGAVLVVSCVALSTLAAMIAYRFIEVPITQRLRRVIHDHGRTALASPETAI